MIDKDKNPIGYQLYKGDTYEGHTFPDMVNKLKDQHQIDRMVLVADRDMLSEANRQAVTENGYEFIMGERLKNLPRKVKESMVNLSDYSLEWVSSAQDPVRVRYKVLKHEDRTIIVTYSQKRAEKNRKDRAERIEKATQLIKYPSGLKNKARRFYLKQQNEGNYTLDEEKIANEAKYDGFLAISTNANKVNTDQILDHYHHLFQIEHSFRTFKSYPETRPMFHWTDKRIEGHICLCYLSYVLLNHVVKRMEKHRLTEAKIRKILSKMQVSHIKQPDEQYYMKSNPSNDEQNLLKHLNIKPLTNLIPVDKITEYLT